MRFFKANMELKAKIRKNKFHRYADPNYSIDKASLEEEAYRIIENAIALLEDEGNQLESSELVLLLKQVKKLL